MLLGPLTGERVESNVQVLVEPANRFHFFDRFSWRHGTGEHADPVLKQVAVRQRVARVHGGLYLLQESVRQAALLLKLPPELSRRHPEQRLHLLPDLLSRRRILPWRLGLVDLHEAQQGHLEQLHGEHGPAVRGEQALIRS